MKLTEQNRDKLLRLARLTDAEIAANALDVAAAAFMVLVRKDLTIGANGDDGALHIRVGRSINGEFVQWDERTLGNGAEFAANTGGDGKAGTVAEFGTDSAAAFREYGEEVGPDGPRRWRGGKFVDVTVDYDEDTVPEVLDPTVATASGVQGDFDEVPAAAGGQALAGQICQREKARHLLKEAGIDWKTNDEPGDGTVRA